LKTEMIISLESLVLINHSKILVMNIIPIMDFHTVNQSNTKTPSFDTDNYPVGDKFLRYLRKTNIYY
jgi:hypothetical protein